MLTVEPPLYQIRGMTILRDHENRDQFYCLPLAGHLAKTGPEGQLAFTLYKYRRDLTDNPALDPTRARGAGLALFEVETPFEKQELVQAELASITQQENARIDPVLFRSATVHAILAHGEGDRLIEDLVETHQAPLTPPYHTSFALALSAEGATLFEQAALGGQLPVGVAYEMRFLALTPSLHARVRMDYERIYDRFSASVGFTYYVSAKLDLDLAWLVEHDFIKIEIVALTDTADRERQEGLVMNLVKARVQRDFFRSGMPPKPEEGLTGPLADLLGSAVGGEVTSASALFVLKAKLEVVREEKEFELLFNGRTAVELTHVCTGFLSTMTRDAPALNIKLLDLDDPFFSALDVKVISAIDFEEMTDLAEVAVHMSHETHRTSFSISRRESGPYRFQVPITNPGADEYRYEVEYHFDPNLGMGPVIIQAGPFASRRRVLIIEPLAHFRYRRLRAKLGPVDPALVPRIHVHLRVPGEIGEPDLMRTTLTLDAQNEEQVWRGRFPMAFSTIRLRARTEWEDARGENHELADEVEVKGDTFVALGPYEEILTIRVNAAVDWNLVTQVRAEIRYRDQEYFVQKFLDFNAESAKGSQLVEIPLLRRDARRYEWRHLLLRKDGTASEGEWAEADQGLLLVGAERKSKDQVQIVWVGAPGGVLGLRVNFWVVVPGGEEEQTSVFLRAGQDTEKTATLPLDHDGRLKYRYEVNRFTAEGEELVKTGEGETNRLVVR
jgi:hypothetical protein